MYNVFGIPLQLIVVVFSNIIIDLFNFDSIIHVRYTLTANKLEHSIGAKSNHTQFSSDT